MQRLEVALGARSYPIVIGAGALSDRASYDDFRGRPLKILSDGNVARHYLPRVLAAIGLDAADALVLGSGESQKTWQTAGEVIDWLMSARLPRDGVLVALGGGVIGDLAGFCASIYQRGIDFVQIPTTLLAQVDSSVGGKTGVNHPSGKNMIGAFHQPRLVIADPQTLKTLPARELRAGLAEVIKYGMLGDAEFFDWLEQNLDRALELDADALSHIVRRCCEMKAAIVGEDERESLKGGPRTLLNLGHTFGHAIETHLGYRSWLHGEAVAVGLCMAADLSARLGWIDGRDADRCSKLVARASLPTLPPQSLAPEEFRALMSRDKKVAGGKLRLVLLRAIGEAVTTSDFDESKLMQTLQQFRARARVA
ncbi:MAG: 3-dehydroquinate synthase [Bacillota bacterium]